MKNQKAYNVHLIKLPDFNRKAFTDLLIVGKEIVPFHNSDLLINHRFFYSHESG